MTPSINRLAESAKNVGLYVMDSEWKLVCKEFYCSDIDTFEQFCEWITGYMYYDALVCARAGNNDEIVSELRVDYDELTAVAGMEAG